MNQIVKVALLFSILLLYMSCSEDTGTESGEDKALPDHYSYTVTQICFCQTDFIGPFEFEINKGEVVNFNSNNPLYEHESHIRETLALPALIARVEELQTQTLARADIEYHPIYGFPSEVYIDIDEQIADEEWGYTIDNFEER